MPFSSAIKLAKSLNAELLAVTAMADLPAYTAFAGVADSSITRVLEDDRREVLCKTSRTRHEPKPRVTASNCAAIWSKDEQVEAIVDFLRQQKADLLVIGLHQRDLHIARLWSTVYELAQDAPMQCSGSALTPVGGPARFTS